MIKKLLAIFTLAVCAHADTIYKPTLQNVGVGFVSIKQYGGVGNNSTDNTTAFNYVKTAVGANGVVYFPANTDGTAATYYFAGIIDLTGVKIMTDSGVVLSVANSTGIDYRSIKAVTDITINNRGKSKQYVIPRNISIPAVDEKNVSTATYSSVTHLTFNSDFTSGSMAFNSATPSAPGTAFTVTTNVCTIETASVATTTYLGPWIRPKVGQLVEMTLSTIAAQTSGHAQAVILDSVGTTYVGVEVIDADNTLKSLTHEVNLISMSGGARTRTKRILTRNETWELGKNASQGRSVLVGVKMISPNTAQFFVNHVLMGTLSLANNADRIFFAMNGAYSGALNGFYDPVAYEDYNGSLQKTLNIAVFGDSISAGSHTTLPWPEMLARDLRGQEGIGYVNVSNYAVSGAKVSDQVTVMGGVTLANFTDVVWLIGVNDIVQGTLRANFETSMESALTSPLAAGCNVVVALPPMYDDGTATRVRGLIRGMVQRIGAYKQASGTVRIADNLGMIGDQIDNLGVGDLIHPTVDGNRIHAQTIAREIAKIYQANQPQVIKNIRRVNGSLRMFGTAAPTTGYFYAGDIIENSAPSAGGNMGWVCVTAGSPGTWKTFGVIEQALTATATLDFASTLAQNSSDLTVTVTGAAVNDTVIVSPPAAPNANTCFTAFVSAADTVKVRFNNYSSAAVDPASATYRVTVFKF